MTTGFPPARDGEDADVLAADRYLETILAAGDRSGDPAAGAAPEPPGLDPETRRAVDAVRRALVRVHPSFRFEERLADRLASMAGATARTPGVVVPFPAQRSAAPPDADPLLSAILAGNLDPADDRVLDLDSRLAAARRPLLVGGAITSAALSLVGVAWVAWRATRQSPSPDVDPVQSVVGGLG
jgi:hypothetical protein